jgi:hypothetical protein
VTASIFFMKLSARAGGRRGGCMAATPLLFVRGRLARDYHAC